MFHQIANHFTARHVDIDPFFYQLSRDLFFKTTLYILNTVIKIFMDHTTVLFTA